jgi:hypothetical protein
MTPEEFLYNKYGDPFTNLGALVSKDLLYYFMIEYSEYAKKQQPTDAVLEIQDIWK